MARSKIVYLGACCLFLLVLSYSALQLKLTHSNGEAKRSAEAYAKESQERLLESVRANETLKSAFKAPNASATVKEPARATKSVESAHSKVVQEPSRAAKSVESANSKAIQQSSSATKSVESAHSKAIQESYSATKSVESAHSKAVQAPSRATESVESAHSKSASESFIKLQYALNSTDANLEEPHLFSMGRYVNTFTTYLEAILSDKSIDRKPFHSLRRQFFPWWFSSVGKAYLPWKPQDTPKTGIVLTVGKGNFVLASHCIRTLYTVVNSTLPIQVFYAGDADLPEIYREQLKSLHPALEPINILDTQFNETVAGLSKSGYAMKPFAALASTFERVILIDADTIFMERPDASFEDNSALKTTGLYYFHDRAFHGAKTTDWIKTLMQGAEPSSTLRESLFWQLELEHEQESGVVFINKGIPSAFMSLLFTVYINTQKVRDDVYGNVAGDKETYWLASELSSAPYSFAPNYAGIIGQLPLSPSDPPPPSSDPESPTTSPTTLSEICSAQPLHLTHPTQTSPSRPFWFNSGLRLEKMIDSIEYVNLTHYLPGSATSVDEDWSWRFRSHHTFCVEAEREKWRPLGDSAREVVGMAVQEARRMDVRFLGHEGGEHTG